MFGYAILATLLVGGLVFALDDEDGENEETGSQVSDGQEETFVPEIPEDATSIATSLDDAIFVSDQNDIVEALEGDDSVFGGGGDDQISGGDGVDTLYGFDGEDSLNGDFGNDALYGNDGDDNLFGGAGRDFLSGGSDDDVVNGGSSADILLGGHGQDTINGGQGDDIIFAVEFGEDLPEIGVSDFLDGEEDLVAGLDATGDSDGADVVNGGDGNDIIFLGAGDTVSGGEGSDSFAIFSDDTPEGPAYITDFSAAEDGVAVFFPEGENIDLLAADFVVVNDLDTGDALIEQDGVTLARVEGAGGTLRAEDVRFFTFIPT